MSRRTLVIYANMVKELNQWEARQALAREKVTAKVGAELAADLYVNSSPRDHPPGQDSKISNQDVKEEPGASLQPSWATGREFVAPHFAPSDSLPELGSNDSGHPRRAYGFGKAAARQRPPPRASDARLMV